MFQITALSKHEAEHCPIRSVLSKVTGKWQVLILLALADGPLRFGALRRTVGDITQRVLTENLRGLERDGHLSRTVHDGPPLAVTYELTTQGHSLVEVLTPLVHWAGDNFASVNQSRTQHAG